MFVKEYPIRKKLNGVTFYAEIVKRSGKLEIGRRMFHCDGHVSEWYFSKWKCYYAAKEYFLTRALERQQKEDDMNTFCEFDYFKLMKDGKVVGWLIDGGHKMYIAKTWNKWSPNSHRMDWDDTTPIERTDIPIEILLKPCRMYTLPDSALIG